MWKVLDDGIGEWVSEESSWRVDARGGEHGIRFQGNQSGGTLVSLVPVADHRISKLSESFVRGDAWHLSYPQQEGGFSLDLVLRPVEASKKRLVLESTISIETTLLDSHPTVDLLATGDGFQAWSPPGESDWAKERFSGSTTGASCLSGVVKENVAISVLLGRRDYPFTLDLSDDSEIRLRLFGEFLEKGVIRKARPWICLENGVDDIQEEQGIQLWKRLQNSPLPLAS
ncbi:MAG: hypothetical protein AAF989_15760 [Planctomycetota bacterium]